MKYSIIHFLLFVISFTLVSCEQEIDIAIPASDNRVVIEAEVTTETDSSYVRITRTGDYYSTNSLPIVTNAIVEINGTPFLHIANGLYKPLGTFVGEVNKTYNLVVTHEGKTYKSTSTLTEMFKVDSVVPLFKPAEGFLDEGYTAVYYATDNRPQPRYTYYQFGIWSDTLRTDSLFRQKIIFDNVSIRTGSYSFELPFLRLEVGDTVVQIFRSIDKNMFDFLNAYNTQSSGAPGPFQQPPANLPTNISGGAYGYFATYDVVRTRTAIK